MLLLETTEFSFLINSSVSSAEHLGIAFHIILLGKFITLDSKKMEDLDYLQLSANPLRFEAVNQLTNVFFDDSNKEVFAVRSGGVMGVVVKNADDFSTSINFRMEDRGPVLSIKFSPDHEILAVQRKNNSVEFMNFDGNTLDTEYSQCCKKNFTVLGFVWSSNTEVAFITDHGVELYLVIPEKKSFKHLKTTPATVQWFVWCSLNKVALLASAHGSHLLPVIIKQGTVNKMTKVETEPGRMALERDVVLATLYNCPAVLILRHQTGPNSAEVHIHTLGDMAQPSIKSHVLKMGLSGRFAINVVDDIIIVHHQASRSSLAFDILLPGETDGTVGYHKPIAPPKSFKPVSLSLPGLVEPQKHLCELYSPNWVVFQPNIVIDAKLGCLWHIELCLSDLLNQVSDLSISVQVALNRTNGKSILLKLLIDIITNEVYSLDKLLEAFKHINYIYHEWFEAELRSQTASPPNVPVNSKCYTPPRVLITQDDIYNDIFHKLDPEMDLCKLEHLLLCYITSLSEYTIPVQYNINELLVTSLARQKKFTALLQHLQYGVVSDSKPMACLLLALGNMHPAATQMALDMLSRMGAKEEIQEILLSDGQVLTALKIAGNSVNPRKMLSIAEQSPNKAMLLHNLLMYFRNEPHFAAMFQKDERLMGFVQQYNEIFDVPNS